MTRIKAKVNDFLKFCKLVELKGKDPSDSINPLFKNFLLEAKNGLVKTSVLDDGSVVIGMITYKKIQVIEEGEIPIGSIKELVSVLNRFNRDDEVVIFEGVDNRLWVQRDKPKKIAKIPLSVKDNVEDSLRAVSISTKIRQEDGIWQIGNTQLSTKFKIDSALIQEVLEDGSIEGIDRKYPFVVNTNNVFVTVGSAKTPEIESTIPVQTNVPEGNCIIGKYMIGIDNIFRNLSGNVEISMGNKAPMLIEKDEDEFHVVFLITPLKD